jgi:hypothetical protein
MMFFRGYERRKEKLLEKEGELHQEVGDQVLLQRF